MKFDCVIILIAIILCSVSLVYVYMWDERLNYNGTKGHKI